MKKWIALFLSLAMLLSLASCATKTSQEGSLPAVEQENPADLTAMADPIDSLIRCMLEQDLEYDPQSPTFFWTAMHYFLGEYAKDNPDAEMTEDARLRVPKKLAQEYAIALFAEYDNLPDVPAELSAHLSYDEDWDAYLVSLGDRGMVKTVLSDIIPTEEGYQLTATLVNTMPEDKDPTIGKWSVALTKNAFADGIENPSYLYSVTSVKLDEVFVDISRNASAVFSGLSDNHTVEVTLEDGSISTFQFSDSTVAEKLNTLESGNAFSFTYSESAEDATKTMTLIH